MQGPTTDPVDTILDALVSVPQDQGHPARLWAATKEETKELVAAAARFPASVGWIDGDALLSVSRRGNSPAHRMYRGFRGAGALVLPLAPISAWNPRLRPARSNVRGVQLVHLSADGSKYYLFAGDSGSDKRSVRRAGEERRAPPQRGPAPYMPETAEGSRSKPDRGTCGRSRDAQIRSRRHGPRGRGGGRYLRLPGPGIRGPGLRVEGEAMDRLRRCRRWSQGGYVPGAETRQHGHDRKPGETAPGERSCLSAAQGGLPGVRTQCVRFLHARVGRMSRVRYQSA